MKLKVDNMPQSPLPDPYAAYPNPASPGKLRRLWRWCSAICGLLFALIQYVCFEATRSINRYYFQDDSFRIGALDILCILLWLYLLSVAITGYWRLFARKPAT